MKLHQNIEVMKELIEIISARSNVSVEVFEKDYYVTLILKELSEKENQGYAYFKGGTALYKALKSIRRFSEDIDLTVYVNDCLTNSQKQKRLKESVMNYKSLFFKEKVKESRGSIEVLYQYTPIFSSKKVDILQRFGNIKIEATSFTVSEPIVFLEISPYLYDLDNDFEKIILESNFNIKPFNVATISIERIFVDKLFAAEFYFIRKMYVDFTKHIYDITVMFNLKSIQDLFLNPEVLEYLIKLKRYEENNRIGGILKELEINDFLYLNNLEFYESTKFKKTLKYVQEIYVFNELDYIYVWNIKETLLNIKDYLKKRLINSR